MWQQDKRKRLEVPGPSRRFVVVYITLTLLLGVVAVVLALRAFTADGIPRYSLIWIDLVLVPLAGLLILSPMFRRVIVGMRLQQEQEQRIQKPDGLEKPICPKCSYDLTGLGPTGLCPECGADFQFSSMLTHQTGEHAKRIAEPPPSASDLYCRSCGQDFRGHQSSPTCFNCGRPR